eukprot:scaffold4884_cov165-Amphora_coffeaeformis.AAC.12
MAVAQCMQSNHNSQQDVSFLDSMSRLQHGDLNNITPLSLLIHTSIAEIEALFCLFIVKNETPANLVATTGLLVVD